MGDISSVELVDRWVFEDLSADTFTDPDREEILDDIEEHREHLTVWDRQLTKAVDILEGTGGETIYKRRQGEFRTFFIRRGRDTVPHRRGPTVSGVKPRDRDPPRPSEGVAFRVMAFHST